MDADAATELLGAIALVLGAVALVPVAWAFGRRLRRLTIDARARTIRASLEPPSSCDTEADTDPGGGPPPKE